MKSSQLLSFCVLLNFKLWKWFCIPQTKPTTLHFHRRRLFILSLGARPSLFLPSYWSPSPFRARSPSRSGPQIHSEGLGQGDRGKVPTASDENAFYVFSAENVSVMFDSSFKFTLQRWLKLLFGASSSGCAQEVGAYGHLHGRYLLHRLCHCRTSRLCLYFKVFFSVDVFYS